MSKLDLIKSIINEYGIKWAFNRCLYSAKLKVLRTFPAVEFLFEPKNVLVKRLDMFEIDNLAIKKFLVNLPQFEKERLITEADLAIRGKVKAFSSVQMDYGSPVRWGYSPLTNEYVSLEDKWYNIPDFDPQRGDIKVVWEISRFSHFYLFSRAYLLTGDKKYYEAFSSQISDWTQKNKYSYGANFKCGQECSF